ncbi:hyaluronate lyase [Kitasatospora sp. GAS204A]|uniref:polysaccharide lyase 8 family protein n=1 Tax=unclassified Kitasatospora TaxID=2633591 RepID=UPI002473B9FF|nr:polysaccharide lyase 8 family protein [Kitasatospora sp. GAS204B]MDH6121087.1 hyaluronate lyase [Kitasatospora sp. GAS204B]
MDGTIPRRLLLGAGLAITGTGLLGTTTATATGAIATGAGTASTITTTPADQFETLRAAWSDLLTAASKITPGDTRYTAAIAVVDSTAAADIAAYDRSPNPASVYTDLPFGPVEHASLSYYRIRDTALAWATPGSRYHQDPATAADLVAALALIGGKFYNSGAAQVGNWYHWEIASPQALLNACALLGATVPAADLAGYLDTTLHFCGDPTTQQQGTVVTTGANRSDKCQIAILRGILAKDPTQISVGRDKLSDIFPYVTTSDGYYPDGGYIQHGTIPYNGHYAYVLLGDLSQLAALLGGSAWAITDPGFKVILDSVDLTYAPFMHDGLVMDVVRGRFLSRQGETDHDAGHFITEAILRLAPIGSPDQQARWRALAKGWIQRERYATITTGATPERIALVNSVLDDHRLPAAPPPVGHLQIPSIERAVHRRPGWAWTVALSSSRIARLEALNGENQRGWHTGDGATYLYDHDNGHYTDAYWPTVDSTRLPGTTVDQLPLAPSAGNSTLPPTTWSGGAVLDAHYGAVGLDLVPYGSPMRAKKSWFCLDRGVVALGAGITGSSGHAVETIVENRNLHATGSNALTVDGCRQPGTLGWTASFDGARWAHLEGVGGYLFPAGAPLRALREARTGAWADIDNGPSTGGTTTPCTNRYLTLWLDHGIDPTAADYAYVLLPGASAAQTEQAAHCEQQPAVLANSATVHAIHAEREQLTAGTFFAAGSAGPITVDGPAAVLVRRDGARTTLAASEPTGTSTRLTVTLDGRYRAFRTNSPGVSVTLTDSQATVTLDLTVGSARSTRTLVLLP